MANESPFRFLLHGMTTEQFAALDVPGFAGTADDIHWDLSFDLLPEERLITLCPLLTFQFADRPVLVLQTRATFQISEEDWVRILDAAAQRATIPVALMQHLAVIAVGAARGILHARVRDFPKHQHLLLPIIDLARVLTEEVVFELAGENW